MGRFLTSLGRRHVWGSPVKNPGGTKSPTRVLDGLIRMRVRDLSHVGDRCVSGFGMLRGAREGVAC